MYCTCWFLGDFFCQIEFLSSEIEADFIGMPEDVTIALILLSVMLLLGVAMFFLSINAQIAKLKERGLVISSRFYLVYSNDDNYRFMFFK